MLDKFDRVVARIALPLMLIALIAATAAPFVYRHINDRNETGTVTITIYFDGRDNWSAHRISAWNAALGTPDLKEVRVKGGQKVTFRLMATDVHHGFAVPDFGVKPIELKPGKLEEVSFIADKKGEFLFFCTIPCGPAHMHMTGTLIVG